METEETKPRYYAVADPLDSERILYYYRPKRGRQQDTLQPWPPRRAKHWVLHRKDLPDPDGDFDNCVNQPFRDEYWAKVREARRTVIESIETDPDGAAILFARLNSHCCCCGKALTDSRSKVYGIGPECRTGLSANVLQRLVDRSGRIHAEQLSLSDGVA